MAGFRKSGGGNVALTTRKRRSGGGWVDLTIAKRRSGGVWIDLFGGVVNINNYLDTVDATSPADSSITYALNNDKSITGPGGVWLTGEAVGDYEVRATQVSDTGTGSGTSVSGTLNTWMNLGTSRAWSVFATANGNSSRRWVLTIEIRRVSDLVVVDTATIDIEASTSTA